MTDKEIFDQLDGQYPSYDIEILHTCRYEDLVMVVFRTTGKFDEMVIDTRRFSTFHKGFEVTQVVID